MFVGAGSSRRRSFSEPVAPVPGTTIGIGAPRRVASASEYFPVFAAFYRAFVSHAPLNSNTRGTPHRATRPPKLCALLDRTESCYIMLDKSNP
jgi:hypothetical protein